MHGSSIHISLERKDGHKCSGICAGCSQCSSPLDDYYRDQKKWKRDIIMGNVSGSTFYMFLGVLVIYLIGVSIYTLVQKIKKKRK